MSNHEHSIEALLEGVKSNHISIDEAKAQLSHYDELGFAKIDLHRAQRQGFPKSFSVKVKLKNKFIKLLKVSRNTIM